MYVRIAPDPGARAATPPHAHHTHAHARDGLRGPTHGSTSVFDPDLSMDAHACRKEDAQPDALLDAGQAHDNSNPTPRRLPFA